MHIAVLGAGSWGTALAIQLARAGQDVRLWDRKPERAARLEAERVNSRYLPDANFPDTLRVGSDLEACVRGSPLVIAVVPSQTVRSVVTHAAPYIASDAVVCCASKGIEQGTLMTMEEVLRDVLEEHLHEKLCFLAGPSFAKEVALG